VYALASEKGNKIERKKERKKNSKREREGKKNSDREERERERKRKRQTERQAYTSEKSTAVDERDGLVIGDGDEMIL